jgi:hypothetical protein
MISRNTTGLESFLSLKVDLVAVAKRFTAMRPKALTVPFEHYEILLPLQYNDGTP